VVEEASVLAANGARELVLIAQDLTAYGRDLYGEPSLAPLLRALDGVEGVRWIRLMYANPFHWTADLIEAVASCEKVVPYADMPIQHIADDLLKRMGRLTDGASVTALIDTLRARIPGIALRTNLIVGFPGETEEHYGELLEFVRRTRFDKLVAFAFSPEDTAAATRLPDPVEAAVAEERVEVLLAEQGRISLEVNREQVGRTLEVLIEEAGEEGSPARGRSVREAPEVDGCVRVAGTGLRAGMFYPVQVTGADAYDLVGIHEGGPTTASPPTVEMRS
jgi:ribosomal protein S12 methylthiotransferase